MGIGDHAISEQPYGPETLTDAQPDGSAAYRYIILEDRNMAYRSVDLPIPLDAVPGAAVYVGDMTHLWIQWHSDDNVTATLQLQGKITTTDDAHDVWTDIGSAVAAAGTALSSLLEVPQAVQYLRVNVTAYASGTPMASVGSRYAR